MIKIARVDFSSAEYRTLRIQVLSGLAAACFTDKTIWPDFEQVARSLDTFIDWCHARGQEPERWFINADVEAARNNLAAFVACCGGDAPLPQAPALVITAGGRANPADALTAGGGELLPPHIDVVSAATGESFLAMDSRGVPVAPFIGDTDLGAEPEADRPLVSLGQGSSQTHIRPSDLA